ncbi:MAG: response regulator [Anaerolineales bacterium]|nr:MAG: response regulator [Anaerolineales bacterium]
MGQEKIRILIIDDEENILQVMRQALQREGYETDTVLDALKGLSILSSSEYDLVLCDIAMTRMNGIEFFREIEERLPGMADRILFMTGGILSPSIQKFLKERRVSIIEKPFDFLTLFQGVHNALQRSSGEKSFFSQD